MTKLMDDDLTSPQRKRTREVPGQPLPVPIASLSGQPASNFLWLHYTGRLVELDHIGPHGRLAAVVVPDRNEAVNIYSNGYFGSLVQGGTWQDKSGCVMADWEPGTDYHALTQEEEEEKWEEVEDDEIEKCKEVEEEWEKIVEEEEETRDRSVEDLSAGEKEKIPCLPLSRTDKGGEVERPGSTQLRDQTVECDQVGNLSPPGSHSSVSCRQEEKDSDNSGGHSSQPDCDEEEEEEEEEAGPSCWADIKQRADSGEEEKALELYLEPCEAFYLSYALGCLTVSDGDGELSLAKMWKQYWNLEPDFPFRYAVYHHLRSKGWVVRNGHTFGTDWILYKLGPPFYHASYTVRMEVVDGLTGQSVFPKIVEPVTWADMIGLSRLNETVQKEVLVARVEMHGVTRAELASPHCLAKLAVNTVRIRRWQPGEGRWAVKPKVPTVPGKKLSAPQHE